MPKRTSLPSMLPPVRPRPRRRPRSAWIGLPRCLRPVGGRGAREEQHIAAQTAQPWPWFFTIRPRIRSGPPEITKIESIGQKLESGVGFSNGCAALALK